MVDHFLGVSGVGGTGRGSSKSRGTSGRGDPGLRGHLGHAGGQQLLIVLGHEGTILVLHHTRMLLPLATIVIGALLLQLGGIAGREGHRDRVHTHTVGHGLRGVETVVHTGQPDQ